ncbi:EAL domain-containing protein [Methylophaga sp.]|uniref:EAL domain-containing protein n=1 Tax=Methylophaga sp. TaxID=2024840 RepID=UPI002727798D|nr:EAL domain-containing protein [Methylophaga sp.]MDO8827418.1 EAL domain-containing protein [Methylophaga sp.]
MFSNWSIRALLHFWAVITVSMVLLMAAIAMLSHQHYTKNQLLLTEQVFPLVDNARQISSSAAAFISRQKQIISARNAEEFANVTAREPLEEAFEQSWNRLLQSVEQLQIAPELTSVLSDYYQQFLETDSLLLQQMQFQHQLSEQIEQRTKSVSLLADEIQQLAEAITGRIDLTLTRQMQSLSHAETLSQPDKTALIENYTAVERSSYSLMLNVLRISQLSQQIREKQNPDLLLSIRENDIREQEAMLRSDILIIKQNLQNYPELLTLVDKLQQGINTFIRQVIDDNNSVYQLRIRQLETYEKSQMVQQQGLNILEVLMQNLNTLSARVGEQGLSRTQQSASLAKTARWWMIVSCLVITLGLTWFVITMTSRINHPMRRLRKAMHDLSAEKFDTRMPTDNGQSEFNLLAKDFNLFAAQTQALISKLDETKHSLEIRETRLRAILNGVPEAILAIQADGSISSCNPAAEKILQASEQQLAGQNILQFFAPSSDIHSLADLAQLQQANHEFEGRNWFGETFSMWFSLNPLSEFDDDIWVCVISDISAWKHTKQALLQTSNELNAILENAMVGIAFIKNRQIIRVNTKFEQLFLFAREDIEGQSTLCIHPSEDAFERFGDQAYNALSEAENFEAQVEMVRANGEKFWCAVSGQVINPDNPAEGSIWLYEDVTHERQNEERLTRLASSDILTGLPNRGVFKDRLEHAIHKAQRQNGRLAVFFLDLDHFKHINDSLGHKAGDILLCEVARRIRSCVRDSDTVARLGGDEFTVMLEDVNSAQYVGKIAEKILSTTALPYMLDNVEVNISPSIGISLYPADGRDVDMLVRNADAAMYYAKSTGRNNFQFYSSDMNAQASQRLAMETGLRRAVELQEFYLQFQPQIELETGRVAGAEVLLRWHTEQWGDISPAIFVPVLEDTGLINMVGEWVLKQTCEAFMANRHNLPDDFLMAVNLSGRQFKGNLLVHFIRDLLDKTGMPAKNLELEITESLLMENTEQAVETLRELSLLGITLAIDDFGTGYSSLSYLKQFPLNVLKIDRTFVRDVTEDSDDAAIVNAILAMSNSLALEVVAEGVETAEQLAFLQKSRCNRAQGFYFSKAINLNELMEYIKQADQDRWAM